MSAPIRQLSLWQAPKFLVNSRLGLFSAAIRRSRSWSLHARRLPLSRSYGYILPSSLTRVLPRTLGFSPHTPVSVYGTGGRSLARSFSRQCRPSAFGSLAVPSASRLALVRDGFACPARRTLAHELPISCAPAFLCHSLALDDSCRFRNFNRMSISYAPCLGLGPDLP